MGGRGGRAQRTLGTSVCGAAVGGPRRPCPSPSLTKSSLFLPPVPRFHRPSWPGPGLAGRGEAPSEAVQRTLLRLCTVSAPAPQPRSPAPRPCSPAGGVRPLRLRPAATQPPGDGLPAASTWRAGHHGQVFSGRGPRPSPPAIHTFLKQRKRHQGAKSRENICFWVSKARGSSCC